MFVEFFFEIMNEKAEPLIALIELIKCVFRFYEYKALINKENLHSYIDLEAYKEMKRLKEIKENHFALVRSKKKLPLLRNH